MNKGLAAVLVLVSAGLTVLTAKDLWGRLPFYASTIAPEVDLLYYGISYVVTFTFWLVELALLAFCVMYRRRPGHKPHYVHGNRTAEIIWTVIPAALLVGIAFVQIPAWAKAKQEFPKAAETPVVVEAMAEQFEWNFRYRLKCKPDEYVNSNADDFKNAIDPEEDGSKVAAIGEDIAPKTLFVPVGRKCFITQTSKDVIHSLFIPHMRVKQDVVPGMYVRVWFQPDRFQVFELATGAMQWVTSEDDFNQKFGSTRVGFGMSYVPAYDEKSREVRVGLAKGATTVDIQHQGKILLNQPASSATHAIGVFEMACAELCGNGHYKMESSLRVGTSLMYRAWLGRQTEFGTPPIWKRWVDRKPNW